MIAGMRLPASKAGSGKGAGRWSPEAIVTARAAGPAGRSCVRGATGAYGDRRGDALRRLRTRSATTGTAPPRRLPGKHYAFRTATLRARRARANLRDLRPGTFGLDISALARGGRAADDLGGHSAEGWPRSRRSVQQATMSPGQLPVDRGGHLHVRHGRGGGRHVGDQVRSPRVGLIRLGTPRRARPCPSSFPCFVVGGVVGGVTVSVRWSL